MNPWYLLLAFAMVALILWRLQVAKKRGYDLALQHVEECTHDMMKRSHRIIGLYWYPDFVMERFDIKTITIKLRQEND